MINSANILGSKTLELQEFHLFRDYLEKVCGIHLPDNKEYLVSTRLRKIMQEQKLESLKQLLKVLESSPGRGGLHEKIVDAMTTNETYWFRDNYPFQYFQQKLLPELFASSSHSRVKVWCAACSSGQEPYSLAIIADELMASQPQYANRQIEIVATDISRSMLERCKEGIYDKMEITRGMSDERMRKHFHQVNDNQWQVDEKIRRKVNFKPLNLMESYASIGRFDIIFCRNVLIYFTADLKSDIIKRMHAQLNPDGVLFLGASEGLGTNSQLFEMLHCQPGIAYRSLPG